MALIVPLREVVGGVEAGGGVAVDGADGELPPHPTANSRTTRSDEPRYFMRRRMLPLPHSQIVCSTSLRILSQHSRRPSKQPIEKPTNRFSTSLTFSPHDR